MSATPPIATCQYPDCHRNGWQNPDGSYSAFCGKGHRDAMQQLNRVPPAPGGGSVQLCKNCNKRPAYVDGDRTHDFCGRYCSSEFQASNGDENVVAQSSAPPPPGICKHPQCERPVYVGPDGISSDYCSNRHRLEGSDTVTGETCLLCRARPKFVDNGKLTDFCSRRCRDDAFGSAPLILKISDDMAAFTDVSKQFKDQWRHDPAVAPGVVNIWRIYSAKAHADEFYAYKLAVEHKTGIPDGNSKRRWHGTIRACTLGDSDGEHDLCRNIICSLCGIIRTSFHITKAGQRTNFGRFGAGIYTSATSSKANDYVCEMGRSPYKAMLLNDVVMGKVIKMTTGDATLVNPPKGCDSIVGQPGGDLNYDEAIVYKNEAIRPLFLVIYR